MEPDPARQRVQRHHARARRNSVLVAVALTVLIAVVLALVLLRP